ncbi:nuclear transport factor 2 family protein [Undibacterium terreum]|uniref:Isomerase n=1 Tax=Undibacterium terreum TaxID=1224302 RepID=A0A916XCC8_9BURK|nr:nuclear transport factor 2 family protein [Undibacterium terreum]GGC60200.1 isomerase [Undibacterium terreum]
MTKITNDAITASHLADNATQIADNYIAVWNENDALRRGELIARLFTADADYADPMMRSSGHAGLNGMIGSVQQQFPGLLFGLHGGQDSHNDVVRFSWALGAEGAPPVAYGTDIVVLAADGRISKITGFLDAVAA